MTRAGIGIAIGLCLASAVGSAAVAPSPVAALAGQYSRHFQNQLVSGEAFFSDDIVEIVEIDPGHAYVNFDLNFYNGHTCGLYGIAAVDGGALVYREPADKTLPGQERCTLTIRRKGSRLTWDDGGTCQAYCGARGSFGDGDIAWSSKRRISYIARLKSSSEYKQALAEWHTEHAQR